MLLFGPPSRWANVRYWEKILSFCFGSISAANQPFNTNRSSFVLPGAKNNNEIPLSAFPLTYRIEFSMSAF
jgi:hypothetical protein